MARADLESLGDQVPIKWAVIIMGGYDYYRDLDYNAIQRIEKIMQGRGVPYDVFQDDDIVAPIDNPPSDKYALQYANSSLRYQVIVLLFDFDPFDSTGVNQIYIDWAVGNGTNAVLFNKVAMAVPELLGLTASEVTWSYTGAITSNIVYRTFNDGIKEYTEGSTITLGTSLYFHAIIGRSLGMTVWFNKTWGSNRSLGMANTTYGSGNVWYLGYSLNEPSLDYSLARYPTSWTEWRMEFWGHAINFALNNAEKIPVKIMPFKRWKGAWIIRVDTDTWYWKNGFMPAESILQSGWVYDYQYCVLGYGRANGIGDLSLIDGAPSGYSGIPSSQVMHTSVTGVLQTDFSFRTYTAIIYHSTDGGDYDRIKLDFNDNMNFADDAAYRIWENMTYSSVLGKLYWSKITPDAAQPQMINIGWWYTPMLMQDEATNLPLWRQYGADYGLTYSFHGWQHVSLMPGGSSYAMWNGTQFILNTTYIEEKYSDSRYWMKDKFGGTGYGFEEDRVVISHPLDSHPAEVDIVIDSLPWVLFQYDGKMSYVGFGKKSDTSKYTLSSANEELFDEYPRFAAIEDIARTLYPVISTFAHGIQYNTTFSFPPYSDSIKPASPRDAFDFWLNAKYMLENTYNAYYKSDKVTLEFDANSALEDYVWKFPIQYNGKQFSNFFDNRSIGQVKYTDEDYVYIEFSQGQGAQRLEVTYGTPAPTVTVTVSNVSPLNSGTTNPSLGAYTVAENTVFSITATPNSGYTFDHWKLDGANVSTQSSYSFNVSTSNHTIAAFFGAIPTVTVTVPEVSPPNSGTTNPTSGTYIVAENSLFSISATPLSGYVFDHWQLDGTDVSTETSYSFNVGTLNHAVGAFFSAIPTVTITVNDVSPLGSGTTNPVAGQYQVAQNSTFQISATPSVGYNFEQWQLDGTSVSTQLSYSFNVGMSDHTIGAFFTRVESTQINNCDSLSGWWSTAATLSIDDTDFQEGAGAVVLTTVSPPPWNSYAVMQRPSNLSGYSALQIWLKPSDATRTLRLMVATDWNNYNVYIITGLVSSVWTQVSIDLSTPTATRGTTNFGSISFLRFEYEVRGTSAHLKIDDIRATGPIHGNTVTVVVSTVSPPSSGTTDPTAGTYTVTENLLFSITATPSSGYVFDHWELDGANVGSTNPYSFNVSTSNHAIGAFFSAIPTVTITVNDVSPSSSGTTDPTMGMYTAAENTVFSITATPFSGYIFHHWELDGVNVGSTNPYSFNVGTLSHTVGAFFATIPTVTVTVSEASPYNSGTTNPTPGQYQIAQNSMFEVSATPSSDYVFDHWELDGINVGSANPHLFNVSTFDHTIGALFTVIPTVTITVFDVSPLNSGTTNPPPGTYTVAENSMFTITATPFIGYTFDHWEIDGVSVSTQLSYSFNVGTSSHTITAFFMQILSSQIDSCDSLQYWWARGSVLSIDNADFQEGSGAIAAATTTTSLWSIYAGLQKPMDLSQYSSLQMWVKISDASKTFRVMVATDWSNYNIYTVTGLTSNAWTLVTINLSTPTSSVGSVDFNRISFFRFDYEVRGSTSEFFKIDDIRGVY